MKRLVAFAAAASTLIAAAPAGSDGDPASYRVRAPIMLAAGGTAQRLSIPPAVLAAARSPDLADLRIFDAAGRAMPVARMAPAAGAESRRDLPVLPILGPADSLSVTGVTLRVDEDGRARVAQLAGRPAGDGTASMVVGVLLDARAIRDDATALTLDAEVPGGQPVTFTVEASADLTAWRDVAEQVVYRSPNAGGTRVTIALRDANLAGDYLRVTWRAASRLLAPVTVRRAAVGVRATAGAGPSVVATLPPLTDDHTVEATLPFALPIATIRVDTAAADVVVPVRIFGRDDREQPWTRIGAGIARPAGAPVIVVDGATYRTLRIEADKRSAGFSAAPKLALGFAPRDIAFLAAGRAPFTLAVGREGASDAYLPLDTIVPPGIRAPLQRARVSVADTAVILRPVENAGIERRQALLWAVLLLATGMLAAMAWFLWRRGAKDAPTTGA